MNNQTVINILYVRTAVMTATKHVSSSMLFGTVKYVETYSTRACPPAGGGFYVFGREFKSFFASQTPNNNNLIKNLSVRRKGTKS